MIESTQAPRILTDDELRAYVEANTRPGLNVKFRELCDRYVADFGPDAKIDRGRLRWHLDNRAHALDPETYRLSSERSTWGCQLTPRAPTRAELETRLAETLAQAERLRAQIAAL
jgi:hypothetical protein